MFPDGCTCAKRKVELNVLTQRNSYDLSVQPPRRPHLRRDFQGQPKYLGRADERSELVFDPLVATFVEDATQFLWSEYTGSTSAITHMEFDQKGSYAHPTPVLNSTFSHFLLPQCARNQLERSLHSRHSSPSGRICVPVGS